MTKILSILKDNIIIASAFLVIIIGLIIAICVHNSDNSQSENIRLDNNSSNVDSIVNDSSIDIETVAETSVITTTTQPVTTTTAKPVATTSKPNNSVPTKSVDVKPAAKEVYNTPHCTLSPNIFGTSNFLYYISSSEKNSIYQMSNDGTNKKKICENAWQIFGAVNNTVYYKDATDYCIYAIKEDGSNRTKMLDSNCYGVYFSGEWIFYINESYSNIKLYKIKIDGTCNTLVCNEYMDQQIYCDGYIYFKNNYETRISPELKDNTILRVNVNTSKVEKLGVQVPFNFMVKNNEIFYSSENSIYKFSIATNQTVKIYLSTENYQVNDFSKLNIITVENDWIYFRDEVADGKYMKVRKDGSNLSKSDDAVKNDSANYFFTSSGWGINRAFLPGPKIEYSLVKKDSSIKIKL